MNPSNFLNVFTGSRIVSNAAIVRKSKMLALSRKDLSFVRCRVLRDFVGSMLNHFSSDIGVGPIFPHLSFPHVANGQ